MGVRGLFNAGPAALPAPVLEQVQAELNDYAGSGISVLELSHRSDAYQALNAEVQNQLKALLGLDESYEVLLLTGGASQQFVMIPLNFLPPGGIADYLLTGLWSEKAFEAARQIGMARVAGSSIATGYRRVVEPQDIHLSTQPMYVHLTSNNTIHGTQWHHWPDVGAVPLVADMTSDLLSRRIDADRFHMIYASAQKNLGIAGLTVVIIRTAWLEQTIMTPPAILHYASHARHHSCYNTPPVVAVYVLALVLRWINDMGGLPTIEARTIVKADTIYRAIDTSDGFYQGCAEVGSRSLQNMTFRLERVALERDFLEEAKKAGFHGLAGHRSVGGIRVSIYNGVGLEDCEALAAFMKHFQCCYG